MSIRTFFQNIFQEGKILMGDGSKDKLYTSYKDFFDHETAIHAFELSRGKLFNVNKWSDLPGITSTFELHDDQGVRSYAKKPEVGYFMRIMLPAPTPENWVEITEIKEGENIAEFTVNPCKDPQETEEDVEHFFIKEASSTFKVERRGTSVHAYEIGKNEGVNNQDVVEAGNRGALNTALAAGGWAVFQKLQWKKLTEYLVHKIEINKKVK